MSREIVVVPHTHWDREWYEPHDVFRLRLVHMVDRLIALLEREPSYRFTLDGQAAAIDDYLEMRPEQRQRVAALVARGQLSLGPFLILLDEFGCDGETIIRNLELGIHSSSQLGQSMPVGYLPDMFGHAAQMPQILRGFGIVHGAMWRGVPGEIQSHAFTWVSPDGSSVRCEYLFDGYGNGLDMFALEGQLPALAPAYEERTRSWYEGNPVLAMLGTDHSAPPENLVQAVEGYNALAVQPALSIATLEEHLSRYPTTEADLAKLPKVYGEMRSHARGNLLPGVFSIRTNLKKEMGETERVLAIAERLDVMYGSRDHRAFFDTAWYRIVESTAHDSVTGCGVDATALQVGTRIQTAGNIARGIIDTVLKDVSAAVSPDLHIVFNPSGFERRAQMEMTLHNVALDALPSDVQILEALPTVLGDEQMATGDLPKILRRIHGRELFGQQINGYQWGERSLQFTVAESPVGVWDLAAFTAELEQRVKDNSEDSRPWHILTLAQPRHKALVALDLPALGLATTSASTASAVIDPVQVGERSLANRSLTVRVNDDGTVDIEKAGGGLISRALALVDEGDCGDSYNYGPVDPASAITKPTTFSTTVLERGPLLGRIAIHRVYDIPQGLGADRRRLAQSVSLATTTVVELREGEDFLRVSIDYVNTASDHRLRVLVPVEGTNLETSLSAGQYGVTTRKREAEGGWGEFPLPTYPAYRFASAGDTAVLLTKLTEYELVSRAGEPDALALTLSRSVGMMSVNLHPLRDEPAGSEIPVPGAQYLGVPVHTKFAIMPTGDIQATAVASEVFRLEPLIVRGSGPSDGPLPAAAVTEVPSTEAILESARAVDGHAEFRFVNYLDREVSLSFGGAGRWSEVDLRGKPTGNTSPLTVTTLRGGEIFSARRPLAT